MVDEPTLADLGTAFLPCHRERRGGSVMGGLTLERVLACVTQAYTTVLEAHDAVTEIAKRA